MEEEIFQCPKYITQHFICTLLVLLIWELAWRLNKRPSLDQNDHSYMRYCMYCILTYLLIWLVCERHYCDGTWLMLKVCKWELHVLGRKSLALQANKPSDRYDYVTLCHEEIDITNLILIIATGHMYAICEIVSKRYIYLLTKFFFFNHFKSSILCYVFISLF